MRRIMRMCCLFPGMLAVLAFASAGCSSAVDGGSDEVGDGKDVSELPLDQAGGGCGCDAGALGDGTTCQADDVFEAQATAICDAQGFVLSGIGYTHDCPDGSSTYAKYSCCGANEPNPPPPPDPGVCVYEVLGDGSICQSPAQWKAQATSACEAQDLTLQDIGFSQEADCPSGEGKYAKFACCEP